jgi:hypothetical protein
MAIHPPTLSDREWLVDRRNKIQTLLLDLLSRFPSPTILPTLTARSWQVALGAAFSLWRAVFLMLPETAARTLAGPLPDAKTFLEKLIDSNAIGFSDEKMSSVWASGYYLNNASFRIEKLMLHPMPHDLAGQIARNAWDSCFDLLKCGLENGFPLDNVP